MDKKPCLCGHSWDQHYNEVVGHNPKRCKECLCDRYCNAAPPAEGDQDTLRFVFEDRFLDE